MPGNIDPIVDPCRVLTWIPRDLRERLRELAAENQRALAGEIRLALIKHVAEQDARRPKATA